MTTPFQYATLHKVIISLFQHRQLLSQFYEKAYFIDTSIQQQQTHLTALLYDNPRKPIPETKKTHQQPCSMFHGGARARLIPGVTGQRVGPNAVTKRSPALCQDTKGRTE